MKGSFIRRSLQVAGLAAAVGGSVLAATPAEAVINPPGTNVIAAGGSDTTEEFMRAYLQGKTTSSIAGTTYTVQTVNIPARPAGTGVSVPGDADCPNGAVTYDTTTTPTNYLASPATKMRAPNGSGAGLDFLISERLPGDDASCIDIARSSSAPGRAGETSAMQYYAYAMDAVGWATQSLYAPATLTLQQIQDIYNCKVVNWKDVGGSDAPIQRLLPQAGSGTRNFFLQTYFGNQNFVPPAPGSAGTVAGCTDLVQNVQENSGAAIPPEFRDSAIIPYSAGQWSFQASNSTNPSVDIRRGIRIGGYTTATGFRGQPIEWIAGDSAYQLDTVTDTINGVTRPATVSEANIQLATGTAPDFLGIRYVFNAVDQNNPSYLPSLGLIGFENVSGGTKSPLCSGAASNQLIQFGFAPLSSAGGGANNLAASRCRRFNGTGT